MLFTTDFNTEHPMAKTMSIGLTQRAFFKSVISVCPLSDAHLNEWWSKIQIYVPNNHYRIRVQANWGGGHLGQSWYTVSTSLAKENQRQQKESHGNATKQQAQSKESYKSISLLGFSKFPLGFRRFLYVP